MVRYECSLNGVNLSGLSPDIIITDISESITEYTQTEQYPTRDGTRFLRKQRVSLTETVRFCVTEQDPIRRQLILQQVQKWARDGGVFTRDDRRGQRLTVQCDSVPVMPSADNWKSEMAAVFTAYQLPYWESAEKTTATGNAGSAVINVPGTAKRTKAHLTLTNTGATVMNTATIRTGESVMAFSSLGVEPNQKLEIGYDANGYLYITANGESALPNRSSGSSDDLFVSCGFSTITYTAGTSARLSIDARGLWL